MKKQRKYELPPPLCRLVGNLFGISKSRDSNFAELEGPGTSMERLGEGLSRKKIHPRCRLGSVNPTETLGTFR